MQIEVNLNTIKIMNARDDIKLLLLKNHMTITELAKKMSIILSKNMSRSSLSHKLGKNSLRYDELATICEILGYVVEYKKIN